MCVRVRERERSGRRTILWAYPAEVGNPLLNELQPDPVWTWRRSTWTREAAKAALEQE